MENDKKRERVERFMDAALARKIKLQKGVIVKMRIHEDDMAGFTRAMFGAIDYIRIQQN